MAPELSIDRVTSRDGATVMFNLRGELDIATAPAVRDYFARVDAESILVQLGELEFIDSTGLGALLDVKHRMERRGLELHFRGARGDVRRLLERTGTLAFIES